jgi:RNA polymerase sigma-70 factor (ECF subfamily)
VITFATIMNDSTTQPDAASPHPPVSVETFGLLYDRYAVPVYRYIYSRIGNAADAEDLAAQTFLAALEVLPRYRERGAFAAWLFQIARSKLMDYFRRDRGQVSLDERHTDPAADDPLTCSITSDEVSRLKTLVAALSIEERELLRLRYVADLSFGEMAALLHKREDAVKKSIYRLLAKLQSQMEAKNA